MDGQIRAVGGINGTLNVSTENCTLHGVVYMPKIIYVTKDDNAAVVGEAIVGEAKVGGS